MLASTEQEPFLVVDTSNCLELLSRSLGTAYALQALYTCILRVRHHLTVCTYIKIMATSTVTMTTHWMVVHNLIQLTASVYCT